MAESVNAKLERVRAPRVHIKYEVETGGAIEMKELPFVMGVLGDFTGQPEEPLAKLKERKFVEVNPDNFDDVLKSMKPHLNFTVENMLSDEPGISSRYAGPATAVPVIRGLTGERVVMLENGQRTGDLAGSGADHALSIDPLSATRIEVVRGPASLLYGSGAIGGVVNVIGTDISSHVPSRVEGYLAAQGMTVTPGGAATGQVLVPLSEHVVLSGRGGVRRLDDVRIGGGDVQTVVPDIFVAERSGKWIIEINSATLPKVLVNRTYFTELKNGAQDKASKDWLNDCLADASWLVKALDQRQRTIIKVATEIVKQQEKFFRDGVTHLRPLTLKNVADKIDMHESTVSRVTSNKYLSCSRGTFELKYFFTSGIQSSTGGEAASAEAVKSHIKSLIDNEDPKKILSDDKLVVLLRAKGFDIARRTVAKYREALGLGSSVQRRRQKALEGRAA